MACYDEEKATRAGYEAYFKSVGGKNHLGYDMPTWAKLPDVQKKAWFAATSAITTLFNKFIIESQTVE